MVVPHKPHFFRHVSDCDHAYHVQVHVSENGYVLREKALYPSLIEHIEQFFFQTNEKLKTYKRFTQTPVVYYVIL